MPVIVQNYRSGLVLMQGFMNMEALQKTLEIGKVTFFSRTKSRLWTKGEESHHYLNLKAITCDCDKDCLLIAADPIGPTCHRGTTSCFDGHLPLATLNIALYNSQSEKQLTITQALSNFEKESSNENGAKLLKTVIAMLQSKGIDLKDIDPMFQQNIK
ncbi:MAG: phosphoribosyl-AMP cyclohydrolase [Succinivibrionaceae bacterium]